RTLGGGIYAAIEDSFTSLAGGFEQTGACIGAVGLREVGMDDLPVGILEIGESAVISIVDDLIWNDNSAGRQIGAYAANRGYRNDTPDFQCAQRPDIGAVVDHMRRNGMPMAMS